MKTIWKYYIPLLVIGIGVLTWLGDPAKPILKSIPIVPGDNQLLIGGMLIAAGIVLGVIVYLHEKKKVQDEREDH